ncbi:hypothetical protein [Streptomyces gobiensis]|uniref:hypothetical protein n=1 Tax=Streptomyces gobiensis TaxID=2875706 RepID=UPI001E37BF03|nr:hypothetical protein [Streptomyces gobiensis]UGY92335.1 hypothetical protein test1122_11740 [Streptomyces gobiensis]
MGWTHDYRDVSRNIREKGAVQGTASHSPHNNPRDPRDPLGIPRILRRRARWVSARLRHPRG